MTAGKAKYDEEREAKGTKKEKPILTSHPACINEEVTFLITNCSPAIAAPRRTSACGKPRHFFDTLCCSTLYVCTSGTLQTVE